MGNGRTSVELQVEGYEDTAASTQALTLASGARINQLFLVIGKVRLQVGESCEADGDGRIDFEGPLVADLVSDSFVDGPVIFDTVAGNFCALRFSFQRLEDAAAGAPAELVGLSMLVTGERSDGVPFVIRSDRGDDIELVAQGEALALKESENVLFLAYEVSSWIEAAALDGLDGSPIVIDKDNNQERLEAFEQAVKESSRLFEDRDGDGSLGEDEHDDDDSLAD